MVIDVRPSQTAGSWWNWEVIETVGPLVEKSPFRKITRYVDEPIIRGGKVLQQTRRSGPPAAG